MTTITEMQVHMDCAGCQSKVTKALEKLKGVDNVEIDMAMQKVTVTGWADQKKVLKTVRKTGRRAELWPFAYNPEYNNTNSHYDRNNSGLMSNTTAPAAAHRQFAAVSSHYNYYKHGCASSDRGYYSRPAHSAIFGDQTGATFSDENPHGCSVM